MSPRRILGLALGLLVVVPLLSALAPMPAGAQDGVTRYVRFETGGRTVYGILEGETVRELDGDLFAAPRPTERTHPLSGIRLLAPVEPSKIVAVGRNFESHLQGRPRPPEPGIFAKYPSSLAAHGDAIVRPPGAGNLHYEGELVLVIGRRAENVSREEALSHVFGVTAGNDVSERDWQDADLQWLRAKASDTFAPVGPAVAVGLDPDDLLITTRVNGEVRQQERSSDLIYDVAEIVSYVSTYVTLEPGDLIFTGTPQTTRAMEDGDVVEVEVEGVGVLRNVVRSEVGAGD